MRNLIGTFSSILLSLSALTVPTAAAPAAPGPMVAGDVHVYAWAGTSVYQTTRHTNGTWTPFSGGDAAPTLPARGVGAVATISADQYVLQNRGTPSISGVYLAIHHPDGTWTYPGYVRSVGTADPAAANVCDELNAVIPDGPTLVHGIRRTGGVWTAFGDVESQAGDIGSTVSAATAGASDCRLQLVAVTSAGALFHTIRHPDGTWDGFGDVKSQAGDPGFITQVAAATVANQLQVVVVTSTGRVMHAIRAANGAWSGFGDVLGQTGTPAGRVNDAALAGGTSGQLQVVLSTATGGVSHAIRNANGTWSRIGDVKAEAGNPGTVVGVAAASEN